LDRYYRSLKGFAKKYITSDFIIRITMPDTAVNSITIRGRNYSGTPVMSFSVNLLESSMSKYFIGNKGEISWTEFSEHHQRYSDGSITNIRVKSLEKINLAHVSSAPLVVWKFQSAIIDYLEIYCCTIITIENHAFS
jgi:hypothetical protein